MRKDTATHQEHCCGAHDGKPFHQVGRETENLFSDPFFGTGISTGINQVQAKVVEPYNPSY